MDRVGSLEWTQRTGGALTRIESVLFIAGALPGLLAAFRRFFFEQPRKLDLATLGPPESSIVAEAIRLLRESSDEAMVNHCFRTAYWTLAVMKREKGELTAKEKEEAWIAALLHDIGLDMPPSFGEFTLGGVRAVRELAAHFGWDKESERRASEAITLNINSRVDQRKYGLLASAMNVGGFGEAFYGPYRKLMHPDNIRELEGMHPRTGFHETVPLIVDRELARFPNQRFAVLRKVGFVNLRRRD